MGAPKQKWTSEEDAALKAGVTKYGVGKWSTILKDPEFSAVLHSRSNVDLKDKWRNINVMANGLGSRQRGQLALKNNQLIHKHDDNPVSSNTIAESNTEVVDAKPHASYSGSTQDLGSKKLISRLDDLILEVVVNLKEPRGSSRATIMTYIEEKYVTPPNFEKLLAVNLKLLTENRKLIKVKHCYRIAPISTLKEDSSPFLVEGQQKEFPRVEKNDNKIFARARIDEDLKNMRSMTAKEAAAIAAQAVAEAEAAIAEAEQAASEAEEAEVEAEAARCFAEAATKALKCKTTLQT